MDIINDIICIDACIKFLSEAEKLLFTAALANDLGGITNAIKQGANINAIDGGGETALTKVFLKFNYEFWDEERDYAIETLIEPTISVAQKLLEHGADVNLYGSDGYNALQYAALSRNAGLIKFLLDNGANPNVNFDEEDYESKPLFTIMFDGWLFNDEENCKVCETLLRNAGA
jgi:ankyrin repeat protein